MSDQELEVPRAGRVGPHRESHEPRLKARDFLVADVTPVKGFLEWNGCTKIGERWGMANNGQWSCCGFSMWQHANEAKLVASDGDWFTAYLTSWLPAFPQMLPAYWAYGIAQGEPGPEPDNGVDNASMFAWAYKLGLIYGYGEVDDDEFDWFAQTFHGGCHGQGLDGTIAGNDFNATPRIPWDTMNMPDGHDTLTMITHTDGSGADVTWGAVQPYTAAYRQSNWQDRWVIFDDDDPLVDHAALEAALTVVHGVDAVNTAKAARAAHKDAQRLLKRFEHDVGHVFSKFPGLEAEIKRLVEKSVNAAIPQIMAREFETLASQYFRNLGW